MPQVEIPHTDINALVLAFSLERFGRYMDKANQDKELALAFYAHNMQLSESLYSPLQILEVVLRNRIHQVMTSVFGEWWFDADTVGLQSAEQMHLTKARQDIQRENKMETSGQIVASLSFGFWTGLISPRYDWLWKKHLNAIARKPDKKGVSRKQIARYLHEIRRLRNRVAHHEPIIFLPVKQRYEELLLVLEWLSPPAAKWCRQHSRFEAVHPKT